MGCTGAEKQKYRKRINSTKICCLRTDRANSMRSPGKDRMSLVLIPRGEGLAIAHGANVPIDEEAEAHNPIKR